MQLSDEHLLQQVAHGDCTALGDLFDRHSSSVLALICRFIHDRTSAEDVLQQTFVDIWQKAGSYNPCRGTPIVWMRLIGRSRALEWLRRRKSVPSESELEWIATAPQSDTMEQTEIASAVTQAISQLPEDQASVIRTAFYDGLTHEQIASRFGVPLGTVKSRLRLGMNKLSTLLRPYQSDLKL